MKNVNTKFKLLPPARQELRDAARYYEDCVPGLGHDFLQEVRGTIHRIIQWPQAWSRLTRKSAAAGRIVSPTESFTRLKTARCWLFP